MSLKECIRSSIFMMKRNLMRQLEAALYTLTLPQEHQIEEIVVGAGMTEEKSDTTAR